jgi:hypothetical protein
VKRGGDRVVVKACEEAIDEALKRLKQLEEDDSTP